MVLTNPGTPFNEDGWADALTDIRKLSLRQGGGANDLNQDSQEVSQGLYQDDEVSADDGGAEGFLIAANNLSDVDSASTSRDNLGLGTLATKNSNPLDVELTVEVAAGSQGVTVRSSTAASTSPYLSLYATVGETVGMTLQQTTTSVLTLAVFNTSDSNTWTFDCTGNAGIFTSKAINTNALDDSSGGVITFAASFRPTGSGVYADSSGNQLLATRQSVTDLMTGYPYGVANATNLNEVAGTLKNLLTALVTHGLIV
jgi:hypothetical protein